MWTSSVNYVPCFFNCHVFILSICHRHDVTGLQGPRYCSHPLWGTPIKTRPRQSLSQFCECVNCLKYTFPHHCKSSLKVWKLFFISLYHCIFGQSFYTVQCTPLNVILYTNKLENKSNFKFSEASSLVGFGWLVVGFAIKPIFSPSPPPLMTTIATNL